MLFLLLLIFVLFTSNLNAYIDPGSGSLILQLLIAGAAAGLYAIKVFWKQIKTFFTSIFKK